MKPDSITEIEFLQYARALALSRGNFGDLLDYAEQTRLARVIDVAKSAVAAGTTTDPNWASSLYGYQVIAEGFAESLRSVGAFDGMLPSMRRVPLRTAIAVSSTAYTGNLTAQGAAKPVGRLTLAGRGMLEPQKATAIVVLSEELLRAVNQSLFAAELRTATIAATDDTFIAGIVDGSTPHVTASGETADAFLTDLRAAGAKMNVNGRTRLFLIADPNTVMRLSLLSAGGVRALPDLTVSGGDVGGITVIPTDVIDIASAGTSTLLLVDAQQIAAASDTIVLDSSQEAVVEMNSAPVGGAAAVQTSLWQSNLTGLIAHRWFGFKRLADTACCEIQASSYGA